MQRLLLLTSPSEDGCGRFPVAGELGDCIGKTKGGFGFGAGVAARLDGILKTSDPAVSRSGEYGIL